MHEHHLVGRIGRFTQLRELELDTSGVYWCVVGVLCAVVFLSGLEPVVRAHTKVTELADAQVLIDDALPSSSGSVYPQSFRFNQFPNELSQNQERRLNTPVYEPPVIYPGQALRLQLEGSATVGFFVSSDGAVTQPHIVTSSHQLFEGAALRAVMNSRYSPMSVQIGRQDERLGINQHEQSVRHSGQARSLGSVMVHRHFRFSLDKEL